MKNKIFDFRLYWQGIKRLRVIGIALAILCIVASLYFPLDGWFEGPQCTDSVDVYLDGEEVVIQGVLLSSEEKSKFEAAGATIKDVGTIPYEGHLAMPREIADDKLVIPVKVASFLSPVLVLIMFAYLNKRRESDFYHAIPMTRVCVFTSFLAATLTWIWSILIVSALLAGMVWALCPYITFSFGGLILGLLDACLNTTLLAAFTTVAMSLTGTVTMSIISTGVLIAVGRAVLYIFSINLDEKLQFMQMSRLWGGYFDYDFFYPLALMTGDNERSLFQIIYTVLLTLALFALGGWLYTKRRSEAAERSVPGRWVHRLLQCMLTLPFALLMIFQFLKGYKDEAELLMWSAATLLVFYLYELLTTKKGKGMLRATPWLGVVLCVCAMLVGGVHVMDYVEEYERTDADRIRSATVIAGASLYSDDILSRYEYDQIREGMSDDPAVIALIADAWTKTQDDGYLSTPSYRPYYSISVRLQLKSGRYVYRQIWIQKEDYPTLMQLLKQDLTTSPIPDDENVQELWFYDTGKSVQPDKIRITGAWQKRFLEALRQDSSQLRIKDVSYTSLQYIDIVTKDPSNVYRCYLDPEMTHTYSLLYELYKIPAYRRADNAREVIESIQKEQTISLKLYLPHSAYWQGQYRTGEKKTDPDWEERKELLLTAILRGNSLSPEGQPYVLYFVRTSAVPTTFHYDAVPVRLTSEEYEKLKMLFRIPDETPEEE